MTDEYDDFNLSEIDYSDVDELYDQAVNDRGMASYWADLESDPSEWTDLVTNERFRPALEDLNALMADFDRRVELNVGEDTFEEVNSYEGEVVPDVIDFYIAEDHESFTEDINHPFFLEMDPETFNRPGDSPIAIGFGSYEDTINVPEDYSHLDIKIPTRQAKLSKQIDSMTDLISEDFVYGVPEDIDNFYEE